MNTPEDAQTEFDFSAGNPDGLAVWRNENNQRLQEMARKLGYPLGRKVELVLNSGPVLRGLLQYAGAPDRLTHHSHIRLRIDCADFAIGEIDSCTTLEEVRGGNTDATPEGRNEIASPISIILDY